MDRLVRNWCCRIPDDAKRLNKKDLFEETNFTTNRKLNATKDCPALS
jgi:hypothetical protein